MVHRSKPNAYAWLVFLLSASFIFYKYILQISPAVMTHQLMSAYSLTGTGLGFMVGFYFYTYMFMQIPSGMLLDRFGPRKMSSAAILICAVGVAIFAQTHTFALACLGRLLIGFGAAFATTGYMKLASLYFPPRYFALLSGLFGAAGMIGAGVAQAPLAFLIDNVGLSWRSVLLLCALLGLLLALALWFIIKDVKHDAHKPAQYFSMREFRNIFKNKANWPLIFYSGFAFIPVAVFGGLWGVPYLMQAYTLSKTLAASIVSLSFFGFALGAVVTGIIGKHTERILLVMTTGTLLALIFMALVLYVPHLPLLVLHVCVFLFGMSASSFLLSFAIVRDINSPAIIATAIGVINMGDPLCGAVAEPLIGKILDLHWDGTVVNNVRIFSTHAYRYGLSVLTVYLLLALLCCCFIKERRSC